MVSIEQNASYVTFINTFRCRPENQEEVVRINAEIIGKIAAGQAGFISAAVHRSLDGTCVFNYLQWETAGDLHRMQASPEFRAIGYRLAGLVEFEPHQCEVAYVSEGTAGPGR